MDLNAFREFFNLQIRKNHPDFNFAIDFKPSKNYSFGHLTSTIILDYAKFLKIDPNKIINQVGLIYENDSFAVFLEQNYLNLFFKKINILEDIDFLSEQYKQIDIYLPPANLLSNDSNSILRIYCLVYLQAFCCSFLNKNFSIRTICKTVNTLEDTFLLIKELMNEVEYETQSKELYIDNQESFVNFFKQHYENNNYSCVYSKSLSFSKTSYQLLINKINSQFRSGDFIIIPDSMLTVFTDQEAEFLAGNISQDEFFQICFYLCQNILQEEVSCAEAVMNQKNNINWFLEAIRNLLALVPITPFEDNNLEISSLNKREKEFIIFLKFLPLYLNGASLGMSCNFVQQLLENLNYFLQYFNSPNLRQKIENNSLSVKDLKILNLAKMSFINLQFSDRSYI